MSNIDKERSGIFTDSIIANIKTNVMHKARHRGADCPVCGQFVKVYKRTINASMAAQLIRAQHFYGMRESFHVKDLLEGEGGGADFAKLRYWNLIVELHNDNPFKKNSGRWMVTEHGSAFVMGFRQIPKYALIYNGRFLDFDGDETITIQDSLGNKFNYQELINMPVS